MLELTEQEKIFADSIANGMDQVDAVIQAGYNSTYDFNSISRDLLQSDRVKEYLSTKTIKEKNPLPEFQESYKWKLKQLFTAIDELISDLKSDEALADILVKLKIIKTLCDVIKVTNDMQGHNSPETILNLDINKDSDVKEAVRKLEDLKKQFDKGY